MIDNPDMGGPVIRIETDELIESGGTYFLPYDVEYTGPGHYCIAWVSQSRKFNGKYVLAKPETEEWDYQYNHTITTGHGSFYVYKRVSDNSLVYIRTNTPSYNKNATIFYYDSAQNKLIGDGDAKLEYIKDFVSVPFLPEPIPGVAYINDEEITVYNNVGTKLFPELIFPEEGTFTWEEVGFTEDMYMSYVNALSELNPYTNEALNVSILGKMANNVVGDFFSNEATYGRYCSLEFNVWSEYQEEYGIFKAKVDYTNKTVEVSFSPYDG